MKRYFITLCMLLCMHRGFCKVNGQASGKPDSIAKGDYTLIFITKDAEFAAHGGEVKKNMVDIFFKVYAKEAAMYNVKATKKVIFVIDPAYNGVAATTDSTVMYNPRYMLGSPMDVDVVTHEVMHIVQAYGESPGPGWLTEGIADYARYKFGIHNADAGWVLPNYQKGQSYTDSYRITARFLVWLEKQNPGIVKHLNSSMRNHTYTENIWYQFTGISINGLWNKYAGNPSI